MSKAIPLPHAENYRYPKINQAAMFLCIMYHYYNGYVCTPIGMFMAYVLHISCKDTNTIKYVCISPQKVEHVGCPKSKSIGQDALRVCWIPTASQVPHLSKAIPPTHALHGRNLSSLSVPTEIVPLWNDDLLVSLFHLEFGKLYIYKCCVYAVL